ncbi:MAG: glycosyltransferase [Prevotella sp.]|nr:glycosyltransferase [Prevotella sp.]
MRKKIGNVFLSGVIDAPEKVWMYRNCEAFLFPSKFEGFGLPLIEAMLFGKPVFSSRYTSLPEVGNKYAFFWDNFDAKHMKEVVEKNLNRFGYFIH